MLIFSTILILLSIAVDNRRDSSILYSRIAILVLIYTFILLLINNNVNFFQGGIYLYGSLMQIKPYTLTFIMYIIGLTIIILGISSFLPKKYEDSKLKNFNIQSPLGTYVKKNNIMYIIIYRIALFFKLFNIKIFDTKYKGYEKFNINYKNYNEIVDKMMEHHRIIEYSLIVLFCLTGSIFLITSSDIVSVFLSIELQSYGLYLLSSIHRNSESSVNAGLTYFLLGGLSSCLILLGLSLLYINTGNTNLENIYIINSIANSSIENKDLFPSSIQIQIPIAIASIGLLFKIAASPYHFWSPDVYDAIPTIVTTYVAIIAKIPLLMLLLELVIYTEDNNIQFAWTNNIILSSVLSLIIGSVLGLVQYRIKRLYAYSTISHIGFILLALSVNTSESIKAFFFYIIQYSLCNLNTFLILISIGYITYLHKQKNNNLIIKSNYSPIQLISQLKGLFYINPILSISFIISLFSFVGIPPLIGFFGKQMVLSVAIDNGYMFVTFIAILTSVISAVYYLSLVKVIFFEKNDNPSLKLRNSNNIINISNYIPNYISFIISLNTTFILLFIFYETEVMNFLFLF